MLIGKKCVMFLMVWYFDMLKGGFWLVDMKYVDYFVLNDCKLFELILMYLFIKYVIFKILLFFISCVLSFIGLKYLYIKVSKYCFIYILN